MRLDYRILEKVRLSEWRSLMDGVENLDEQVCSVLPERSGCNPGLLEDWSPCCTSKDYRPIHSRGVCCIGSRMDQASSLND